MVFWLYVLETFQKVKSSLEAMSLKFPINIEFLTVMLLHFTDIHGVYNERIGL